MALYLVTIWNFQKDLPAQIRDLKTHFSMSHIAKLNYRKKLPEEFSMALLKEKLIPTGCYRN